jgi:general secretion pathway protein G
MTNRNTKRAFTLIELLIVVAIIAILAAIAVPNFLEAQTRSKVSRAKADLRSMATAVESYYVDNNEYMVLDGGRTALAPPDSFISYGPALPDASWPAGSGASPLLARLTTLTSPISYMTSIPKDVFNPGADPFSRDWPNIAGNDVMTWGLFTPGMPDTYNYSGALMTLYAQATGYPEDTARWVLFSYGPAQNPMHYDAATDTVFFDNDHYFDEVYDPTNGTISEGLVLRLGP